MNWDLVVEILPFVAAGFAALSADFFSAPSAPLRVSA